MDSGRSKDFVCPGEFAQHWPKQIANFAGGPGNDVATCGWCGSEMESWYLDEIRRVVVSARELQLHRGHRLFVAASLDAIGLACSCGLTWQASD